MCEFGSLERRRRSHATRSRQRRGDLADRGEGRHPKPIHTEAERADDKSRRARRHAARHAEGSAVAVRGVGAFAVARKTHVRRPAERLERRLIMVVGVPWMPRRSRPGRSNRRDLRRDVRKREVVRVFPAIDDPHDRADRGFSGPVPARSRGRDGRGCHLIWRGSWPARRPALVLHRRRQCGGVADAIVGVDAAILLDEVAWRRARAGRAAARAGPGPVTFPDRTDAGVGWWSRRGRCWGSSAAARSSRSCCILPAGSFIPFCQSV